MNDLRLKVLIVLLCLGELCLGARTMAAEPPAQITVSQARALVDTVISHEDARASVEGSPNNSRQDGPGKDFYGFDVIATTQNVGGGALIAGYAVNRWTGDVWEIEGDVCRRVDSAAIGELFRLIRARLRLSKPRYERLQKLKPVECE